MRLSLSEGVAAPRYTVESVYGQPGSLSRRFRKARFHHVARLVETIVAEKGHCRIIDIGGTAYYWNLFPRFMAEMPVEIDMVNLEHVEAKGQKLRSLVGNATDLSEMADMSYDLVHSNSVIEHVGNWASMQAMARNVRRLAPAYFVQTPNFWFPYEPHFRAPLFHWLPEHVRARLLLNMSLGFGGRRSTLDAAMRSVQATQLLDRAQMRELFPDARLEGERVLGLTKSLMAIRDPRP